MVFRPTHLHLFLLLVKKKRNYRYLKSKYETHQNLYHYNSDNILVCIFPDVYINNIIKKFLRPLLFQFAFLALSFNNSHVALNITYTEFIFCKCIIHFHISKTLYLFYLLKCSLHTSWHIIISNRVSYSSLPFLPSELLLTI